MSVSLAVNPRFTIIESVTAADDHWKRQPRDPLGADAGQWIDEHSISEITAKRRRALVEFFRRHKNTDPSDPAEKIRSDIADYQKLMREFDHYSDVQVARILDSELAPNDESRPYETKLREAAPALDTPESATTPPTPAASADDFPPMTPSEAARLLAPARWKFDDYHLVQAYTDGEYIDINDALRNMSTGKPHSPAARAHFLERGRKLAELMRPSPRAVTLLRGTRAPEFGVQSNDDLPSLVGRRGTVPGFSSTSVSRGFGEYSDGVLLHIQAPAGTPMLYLEGASANPHEHEMLLPPGIHYEVIDVRRPEAGSRRWHVTLRVVPK